MNIVFPLSVVDGIMGGLFLCMNSCMYARMYVHLCICILVCMHVCVYVWRMTLSKSKRKQSSLFVVRKYLRFTGKLDLAKYQLDFYSGYKFYRGSCLICLIYMYS